MRITLVGSTRFAAKFLTLGEALTLEGHTVYGLGFVSSHKEEGADKGPTPDQKMVLDLVHLKKIMDSDAVVLVTDETCYFGESTQRELAWAGMLGKPTYLGDDDETPSLPGSVALLTPTDLKEEIARRRELQNKLRGASIRGAMSLGDLLRHAAESGDLDEDEGGGHGRSN